MFTDAFSIACKDNEEILPLKPEIIASGSLVGYAVNQEDRIIASQADWTKFLEDYNYLLERFGNGDIEENIINFNDFKIVIVFDGLKRSVGYDINLIDVEEDASNIMVSVIHNTPDQSNEQIVTQPYIIVKIPTSDKSIIVNHTAAPPWVYGTLVAKGSLSGYEEIEKQNIVIQTQEDWMILLNQMNSYYKDPNFLSYFGEISFDTHMVIVVFDEVKNYCCGTIDITDILETETEIKITVQNLWFGANAAIAQPFHISKIPKTQKPIVFLSL